MSAFKVATRYAKSLLDLSIEQGIVEEVHRDMKYISDIIKKSAEFSAMLKSPLIHPDKKDNILTEILKDKVSKMTMTFLKIVTRKHREAYLDNIALSFVTQYNVYKHITPVKLTTATAMDQNQVDELLEKVKREAGLENIELVTEVDENLIGGFVLQYEDKLFDASVSRSIGFLKSKIQDNSYIKRVFK